jgi:hypothetical protein
LDLLAQDQADESARTANLADAYLVAAEANASAQGAQLPESSRV